MTTAQKQTVDVAIASMILGILGLTLFGPLGSIPAVICGHVANSKIKKNPETLAGSGLALAGLIMGYVQIGLMVIMIPLLAAIAIPSFVKARDAAQTAACRNNLRMLDAAKEQAAMAYGYEDGTEIPQAQIEAYLKSGFSRLVCAKGGGYTANPLGEDPECSVHGALRESGF